jgi:hypothetical protein
LGTFDLLGVSFDRNFSVKPYVNSLARESRFRAGTTFTTWPTAAAAREWPTHGKDSALPPGRGEAEAARVSMDRSMGRFKRVLKHIKLVRMKFKMQ